MDNAISKWRWSMAGWHCLFAAKDISRFEPIWARIQHPLASKYWRQPKELITAAQVRVSIEDAYRAELRHMAEVNVLNPWTMDLPTFEGSGRASLGDAVFKKMHAKITALNTGVDLLVFGFDNGTPHILQATNTGEVHDVIDFSAIGTGSWVALDVLRQHEGFLDTDDAASVIYRLCEAKFTAENSPGVGSNTSVVSFSAADFMEPGESGVALPTRLDDDQLKAARALWKRRRTLPIPERVLATLRGEVILELIPYRAAFKYYQDSSLVYSRTMKKLKRLRADGLVDDEQWKSVEMAQQEVRDADAVFYPGFVTVRQGAMATPPRIDMPPTFVADTERLEAAHARVEQIRREITKRKRKSR